ncbi:MAG: Radical domain protein [Bryobacterales bacterium]|nr:Radical domain protein [Bryobacterales bacterium]
MAERAAQLGANVVELKNNRLGIRAADYVQAKTALAITTSTEIARKLQPIPPSADWQFHIAQGCPAHCQYCYLAGSLSGAPITRAYANIDEILHDLKPYAGKGRITSASATRSGEGTTFEASCYTDPLGIEHLTGSLAECIRFFGSWGTGVQLRWTTKFDEVDELLKLEHRRRTRVRFSLTARKVSRDFEGGTATRGARLAALRKMAMAGYPVGLTIAPIMPVENWREEYRDLLRSARAALDGVPDADVTVEAITHRFTPKSKLVQLEWYPQTTLDLNESARDRKTTKFGSAKFVYPKPAMNEMRSWFQQALSDELPDARLLYWT